MKYTSTLVLSAMAAASPVFAADTAATAEPTLEEVVITAQKRTERLQDVTVSAAVLSSDTITKLNAGDISDLNRLVPSVNLNGTINGRVPLGVRGISSVSNEGTVGLSSGVAIMIDGVPVPSDSRAGNALEDVQSIEVLKGPQATLGGRTAAQGVINVVTRRPSDTLTGSLTLMGTNDKEYRGNGFISGPISDTVRYSFDGYYTTREFPIGNLKPGRNTSEKVYGGRGKLFFQPNEDLDITLAARLGRDNSDGFNFVYTHLSPGIFLLTGAGGPPFMSQASLLPGITPSFTNLNYSSPVHAYSTVDDTDASVDLQYRIGGLTLGSTTAYQHEKQVNVQDLFAVNDYFWNLLTGAPAGGTPPFYDFQQQSVDVKQLSEELKLVSATDQPFSYIVGLFYSDTKVGLRYDRDLLPALLKLSVEPITKTTDLYARSTWKVAEKTSLITGLRYNYDQISYTETQDAYAASFPPPVIIPPLPPISNSSNESTVVGDISLQQKFADDSMVYLSYTRGYSPAAYNTSQALTSAASRLGRANKENIDQLELGSKGTYLNNRVTLNAAIFDTKYKDFQVQIFDQSSTSINPPLILTNAGEAETRGIELDTAFAATDRLRIDLNAAYIDAKFNDYKGAPCYYPDAPGLVPAGCTQAVAGGPVTQNLDGKPMPNSPKFKAALSIEQSVPLANATELVFAGNYSYRTSAQMLVDQNPYAIQGAFGILNLSVGWRTADKKTSLTLFANNVTDKIYYTDVEDFWSGPWGSTNTVIGQPARDAKRYFGLRFSTGF